MLDDLKTIGSRDHEVEHNDRVVVGVEELDRHLSVRSRVDGDILATEQFREEPADGLVILDDQRAVSTSDASHDWSSLTCGLRAAAALREERATRWQRATQVRPATPPGATKRPSI